MELRRATVFDVFQISRVLTRSITYLCAGDHHKDAALLAAWTGNKDPQTIRRWIQSGATLWLAEVDGVVAGVGGVRHGAELSLLYVDPAYVRRGIGLALLVRLEHELAGQGCTTAHLNATTTARAFYRRYGWLDVGAPTNWLGMPHYPMRKSLHPAAEGLRPAHPGDMSR
nr:GNAT family N-acetyltransferase [Ruegeria sp. HKCCA4707]